MIYRYENTALLCEACAHQAHPAKLEPTFYGPAACDSCQYEGTAGLHANQYRPINGPLMYDPATGLIKQGNRLRIADISTIRKLIDPNNSSMRLRTRRNSRDYRLTQLQAEPFKATYADPLKAGVGFGLLPFCPITKVQYEPEATREHRRIWNDRAVCIHSGMIYRTQPRPFVKLGGIYFERVQIIAAAALDLHPLTPVMAWYRNDPATHGFGIGNIGTPDTAGSYLLDGRQYIRAEP